MTKGKHAARAELRRDRETTELIERLRRELADAGRRARAAEAQAQALPTLRARVKELEAEVEAVTSPRVAELEALAIHVRDEAYEALLEVGGVLGAVVGRFDLALYDSEWATLGATFGRDMIRLFPDFEAKYVGSRAARRNADWYQGRPGALRERFKTGGKSA